MVTNPFNEWFAIPKFAQTSTLHMSPTWNTAVYSVNAFLEASATSRVSEDQDAYLQANVELRALFVVPPTIEEFTHAIANIPINSAAGPTGNKYKMMKSWSPKVVEAAHRAMCSLKRCTYQSDGDGNGWCRYQRDRTKYRH